MKRSVTALAIAALAALPACGEQREMANQFQNSAKAIENAAETIEAEAANATGEAADAVANRADAIENQIDAIDVVPSNRRGNEAAENNKQ